MIPIGINIETNEPVTLSHTDRFTGAYIVGKMGMGKSTLIQSLLADHLASGHGFLVMEPKGDLVADILTLIPKHREQDVILLDYGDTEHPPGFDIFDMAGIDTIHEQASYIREIVAGFEKTLGKDSWGANIENLFMAVANTFTQNPGVVLSDIKRMLTDDAFRAKCAGRLTSPFTQDAREFWERYDRMKGKDTYIQGTITRVQRFLFDPILQAVTVQAGRSLDVGRAIRERKIVLISLPERTLGAKGMELLGTLYLSRVRLATQRQFGLPETERVPFFVYLDEFQRFASGDVESFVAEARGAKVGLTMAHQWRSQIEDPGVRQAPMAVGNTFVFQVTPEDAAVFARGFTYERAREQPPDPEPPHWIEEKNLSNFYYDLRRGLEHDPYRKNRAAFLEDRWHFWLSNRRKKDPYGYWRDRSRSRSVNLLELVKEYLWHQNQGYHEIAADLWEKVAEAAAWTEEDNDVEASRGTYLSFSEDVRQLGESLARDPVDIGARRETDEWRAWNNRRTLRSQSPERASTAEIAKGLTQLPNFVAHCKLHQGKTTAEVTIRTVPVEATDDRADVEAIREESRRRYCMGMEEAMDMIAARQGSPPVAEPAPEPVEILMDAPPKRW